MYISRDPETIEAIMDWLGTHSLRALAYRGKYRTDKPSHQTVEEARKNFVELSQSITEPMFKEGEQFRIKDFFRLLGAYQCATFTVVRNMKRKSYHCIKCFHFKKTEKNKSTFTSPCQFQIQYVLLDHQDVRIKSINHTHNHTVTTGEHFWLNYTKGVLKTYEGEIQVAIEKLMQDNSNLQSINPKLVKKKMDQLGLISKEMLQSIDYQNKIGKQFQNLVNKMKREYESDYNEDDDIKEEFEMKKLKIV